MRSNLDQKDIAELFISFDVVMVGNIWLYNNINT